MKSAGDFDIAQVLAINQAIHTVHMSRHVATIHVTTDTIIQNKSIVYYYYYDTGQTAQLNRKVRPLSMYSTDNYLIM